MSKKIKILTPRIYEHSDFFHDAVDFAREHSLNTNELCLELSHYLVDNFDKVWKIERPRVYKKLADLEAKLAESEKRVKDLEFRNKNLEHSLKVAPNANAGQRARIVELREINHQLKQQLAEKDLEIKNLTLAHFESETNKPVLTTTEIINQDKISFCIEKLKKVKKLFEEKYTFDVEESDFAVIYEDDVDEIIDNQIAELKKERK